MTNKIFIISSPFENNLFCVHKRRVTAASGYVGNGHDDIAKIAYAAAGYRSPTQYTAYHSS